MADEVKFLLWLLLLSQGINGKCRRQRREVTIMRANSLDFFQLAFFTGLLSPLHTASYKEALWMYTCRGRSKHGARGTGFIEKESGNSGEYVAQNEKSISCTDALFTVSRDKFFSVSLRRISAWRNTTQNCKSQQQGLDAARLQFVSIKSIPYQEMFTCFKYLTSYMCVT